MLLLPQNESFLSKEGTGSLLLVDCVALISRISLSAIFCWEIFVYYLDTYGLHKHFYRPRMPLMSMLLSYGRGVLLQDNLQATLQMLFWDSLKNMTES